MKKNFLEEQIEKKNKIDYSFNDVVNKINIKEKTKKINLKLFIPSLSYLTVCLIAVSALIFNPNGTHTSETSSGNENISLQEPGDGNNKEDGILVTSIPQTLNWNNIEYVMVKNKLEGELELDELISHLVNQEDVSDYNIQYPTNTPITGSVYDRYLGNRLEVYSIVGKDINEMIAIISSVDTYYYVNNELIINLVG